VEGISVVIADDHPPTRAGVRQALERAGFEVCSESGDAVTAVAAARKHEPDVCILDVHMPGGGGIEAARQINSSLPGTALVMLTVSDDDEDLFAALRAGASGYLLKDMDPERLPRALEGILEGEAAVPRSLVARIVEEYRGHGKRRIRTSDNRSVELSDREFEILARLRDGESTKVIADELSLSQVTVRRHISTAVKKLRAKDRDDAIRMLEE
jgi:DNA-binding NarL/FixJ family response regulator